MGLTIAPALPAATPDPGHVVRLFCQRRVPRAQSVVTAYGDLCDRCDATRTIASLR